MKHFDQILSDQKKLTVALQVATLEELQARAERAEATADLMVDEFKRIRALVGSTSEIAGLCDRAMKNTYQHVPVIVQRDAAEAEVKRLREALEDIERHFRSAAANCGVARAALKGRHEHREKRIVSSGGFGPLRDRILKQRRISYADYQDLRSAHILMDDPAASMVWRLIKTYERHNLSVMLLHAGEIKAIAESWPNPKDEPRRA